MIFHRSTLQNQRLPLPPARSSLVPPYGSAPAPGPGTLMFWLIVNCDYNLSSVERSIQTVTPARSTCRQPRVGGKDFIFLFFSSLSFLAPIPPRLPQVLRGNLPSDHVPLKFLHCGACHPCVIFWSFTTSVRSLRYVYSKVWDPLFFQSTPRTCPRRHFARFFPGHRHTLCFAFLNIFGHSPGSPPLWSHRATDMVPALAIFYNFGPFSLVLH